MGIFMIGSTLRLEGQLTEQDAPFLKLVMNESIHFSQKGITIDMAKLESIDEDLLQILAAGCFLLRLLGPGASLLSVPSWLPHHFKSTVANWSSLQVQSPRPRRKVVV
ncbi:MAG: hypothetical protein G8345_11255 [Magnetococcales bacterium]|nr:hypothetical protein [Magnetococcales bacterium]